MSDEKRIELSPAAIANLAAFSANEMGASITVGSMPGGPAGSGVYAWLTDDPGEGCVRLDAAADENDWRAAIVDQLVIHHIYTEEHDFNPRKAINDLLNISNAIALDPAVSKEARDLIEANSGAAKALDYCADAIILDLEHRKELIKEMARKAGIWNGSHAVSEAMKIEASW